MDISIYKLQEKDISKFKELIRLFENVFEMKDFIMPGKEHLERLLSQDTFFVFVAILKDEVVGGLTAYTLQQYYSEKALVYIYDLAVKTELQRKGIGKELVSAITSYCRQRNIEEVFVQADEVDDYALDFYRSTGATEEKVRHFYYPLTGN
jgi:aminoglycoside 3-N-acetyltransferase I